MTELEAFKIGFIAKCASAGLSVEEIDRILDQELMEKTGWWSYISYPIPALVRLAAAPFTLGVPLAFVAGKKLGNAIGGLSIGKLMFSISPSADTVKVDEAVEAIESGIEELRRSRERAKKLRELRRGRY